MLEDTLLPFPLLSVQRKKVVAAFDGGRLTSNGGVMLLAVAERAWVSSTPPNSANLSAHQICSNNATKSRMGVEGEAIVLFGGRRIYAKLFYAKVNANGLIRLNAPLMLAAPAPRDRGRYCRGRTESDAGTRAPEYVRLP